MADWGSRVQNWTALLPLLVSQQALSLPHCCLFSSVALSNHLRGRMELSSHSGHVILISLFETADEMIQAAEKKGCSVCYSMLLTSRFSHTRNLPWCFLHHNNKRKEKETVRRGTSKVYLLKYLCVSLGHLSL